MPSSRSPSSSSSASAAGTGSGAGSGPGAGAVAAIGQKSCATATMLQTVMTGLAAVREPRLVRERFEEDSTRPKQWTISTRSGVGLHNASNQAIGSDRISYPSVLTQALRG